MSEAIFQLLPLVVPFLLVLFRVVGLFAFIPVFSNASIPGNVKVLLALAIALCIWNVVPKHAVPDTLIDLTVAALCEAGVGFMLGLMTSMVFNGVQLGAHVVSQQMGLSMASVYDPMFEDQTTVIEQVGFWLTLVVFFAVGGHRELINAVVYSYQTVPMGHSPAPELMLSSTLAGLQMALHVAVRIACPGLVAFFLSHLTMGFVARTMPQINLMTIGLPGNLLLGFVMIMTGLAAWAAVAGQAWTDMFIELRRILS
jgi:flagellar biosynthetic protein FliR